MLSSPSLLFFFVTSNKCPSLSSQKLPARVFPNWIYVDVISPSFLKTKCFTGNFVNWKVFRGVELRLNMSHWISFLTLIRHSLWRGIKPLFTWRGVIWAVLCTCGGDFNPFIRLINRLRWYFKSTHFLPSLFAFNIMREAYINLKNYNNKGFYIFFSNNFLYQA